MNSSKNPAPGEEKWQPARLIPTSGVKGMDEQERRLTSALLAVMKLVPEFGRSLLKKAGAPAGDPTTYIEPPFKTAKLQPDGAIIIRRGRTIWRAFVEVKAGGNELRSEQIGPYLDLAKQHNFNALITISNQLPTAANKHPLSMGKRKTKKVPLCHLSWTEVLSEAILQREHRGVDQNDRERGMILDEFIFYLGHQQSGVLRHPDMGQSWTGVRDAAKDPTLRASVSGTDDVALRWDQLLEYLRLVLGSKLGARVEHILPGDTDAKARTAQLVKRFVDKGEMHGTLRVQDAVGDIELIASLGAGTVIASAAVDAPQEGRPQTRVNWLVRQLKGAPDDLVIQCMFGRGVTKSGRLGDVRENPKAILLPDHGKAPRNFVVSQSCNMGTKRSGAAKSFAVEMEKLLLDFYGTVVGVIKPWAVPPPKLPSKPLVGDAMTANSDAPGSPGAPAGSSHTESGQR